MLKDYFIKMKEELVKLCQEWMTLTKYKCWFDVHIFYFFPLVELDSIFIFMNGLDDHIKYMVKIYNPKIMLEAYGSAINFENQEKTNKKHYGGPKMDIGIYGTWVCKGKWKKIQKTWKLRQWVGVTTKVFESSMKKNMRKIKTKKIMFYLS